MEWLKRLFALPEPEPARGDPLRIAEVEAVLAELRPLLAADGGGVHLVAVEDGRVLLSFQGACRSCAALDTTFAQAVEPELRKRLEWLVAVDSV